MLRWWISIAVSLALLWFFWDCARSWTQYFLCVFLWIFTPLTSGQCGRESGTQTEGEPSPQERVDERMSEEERSSSPDLTQCPLVKKALQKVFACAYAQLVLPWYCVPEARHQQPLHQVLSREFDWVIERLIVHARELDVGQVAVGSVRILTQHLHNSKQPDRELLFGSKSEEFALLRHFSDVLVRNIFPEHLWSHDVVRCALNEIIASKGVCLLVKWFSDPDNLNQLVVSQLDVATLKDSTEELNGSDPEQTSLASQDEEGSDGLSEEAGVSNGDATKRKKKGNKLKKGWSKFKDKMKSKRAKKKKMKKMEQQLVMRIMTLQGDASNEDEASSREGSLYSRDSDAEDNEDLESYLTGVQEDMMEFKLSYEMWRVGRWCVSIPQAHLINDELVFTIHLEEPNSPDHLQWDIRKTYMDVIYFRNSWQDTGSLPPILDLGTSDVHDDLIEEARVSVQNFLQELIIDKDLGSSQLVFQFLCPLDKLLNEEEDYRGVWGLLSGLASFLTPGHEEDENVNPQTEVPRHHPLTRPSAPSTEEDSEQIPTILITDADPDPPEEEEEEPEVCSQDDKQEESENPLTHLKMMFKGLTRSRSQESLVSKNPCEDDEATSSGFAPTSDLNGGIHGEDAESSPWRSFHTRSGKKDRSQKNKGKDHPGLPRGADAQKSPANWEQLETTKAIFDLLKEISGNSILINIFDAILKPVMPILKKKVNSFLNKMNPSEEQMSVYIDTMRDKQWPETPVAPQPPRTDEQKNETRERAIELLTSRYSNILVLKKTDIDAVFNLFQDCEENKTLLYMLLSFFFREFFPHERSSSVSSFKD